jgi:hypothetical protein
LEEERRDEMLAKGSAMMVKQLSVSVDLRVAHIRRGFAWASGKRWKVEEWRDLLMIG